jgi:hypothetical protein
MPIGHPGPQISAAVATVLESTPPGQTLGPSVHEAVQTTLENLGVAPGADISAAVATVLESTPPGQTLGPSVHEAVQTTLAQDTLNLGVTTSSDFIEPNIGNESAFAALVTGFVDETTDVPPSPIVPAEFVPPSPVNPVVLDPFGQDLSVLIHSFHSDWPLT